MITLQSALWTNTTKCSFETLIEVFIWCDKAQEEIKHLKNTATTPKGVPNFFHFDKIKPMKTKNVKVTNVYGSL